MDRLSQFLPITVVVAIVLFVIKEALEALRRRRADARRKHAFRTLLARECELNHWTYHRLKETLNVIQDDFQQSVEVEYTVQEGRSGEMSFRRVRPNGSWGGWTLPEVHLDTISKVMLDVAALDRKLFKELEDAYDALQNMVHIRNSLISYIEDDDEDTQRFFEGFVDWALKNLTSDFVDIEYLYRACTGKDLKDKRLR